MRDTDEHMAIVGGRDLPAASSVQPGWQPNGDLVLVMHIPLSFIEQVGAIKFGDLFTSTAALEHYRRHVEELLLHWVTHGEVKPNVRVHGERILELLEQEGVRQAATGPDPDPQSIFGDDG